MTQREYHTNVANGVINEEVMAFATEQLTKLDERNAKRRGEESKKAKENAPLIEAIKGVLTTEPQTAAEIGAIVELSTSKVAALVKKIDGVVVTEVKRPKKSKCNGYALAE